VAEEQCNAEHSKFTALFLGEIHSPWKTAKRTSMLGLPRLSKICLAFTHVIVIVTAIS
jgi:hypothetical protein